MTVATTIAVLGVSFAIALGIVIGVAGVVHFARTNRRPWDE